MKLNKLDSLPIAFNIVYAWCFVLPNRFLSYSKIFDEEGLSLIGKKRAGNITGVNVEFMKLNFQFLSAI